jgi:hypothetical protein
MLTVTYAVCHIKAPYAECRYDECRYAECSGVPRFAEIRPFYQFLRRKKQLTTALPSGDHDFPVVFSGVAAAVRRRRRPAEVHAPDPAPERAGGPHQNQTQFPGSGALP